MTPQAIAALVDAIAPPPGAWPRRPARPGFLTRTAGAILRWATARRDRDHLRDLPDYLLDDVGLTRAQAERLGRIGRLL